MKLKKFLARLLSAAICVGTLSEISITAEAAGSVAVNRNNFPNATFRQYVSDNYDKNRDGTLSKSEIAAVTKIEASGYGISSFKGIEYFIELKNSTARSTKWKVLM